MKTLLASAAVVLCLSACSTGPNSSLPGTPRAGAADTSSAAGSSQGMPQTANSLPAGDRVNAPIATGVSNVGTTRIR